MSGPDDHFVDFTIGPFDVYVGEKRHVTVWYTDGRGKVHHAEFIVPIWPALVAIWGAAGIGMRLYWRRRHDPAQ